MPALGALGVEPVVGEAPQPLPESGIDTVFALFPPRGVDPEAAAEALSAAQRVVYVSSTSVYGNRDGGWVTDDTAPAPGNPWAAARLAAEDALRARGAIVVRAAGIYGADRNVAHRLKAGRVRNAGDPRRFVNLIHVDDLSMILASCAINGVPGEVYLAASGRPTPWIELMEAASRRSGAPGPAPSPMPEDPNIRMFYAETKRCRPARLEELGVELQHPDVITSIERTWTST